MKSCAISLGVAFSLYITENNEWLFRRAHNLSKYYLINGAQKVSISSNIKISDENMLCCHLKGDFSISTFKNKAAAQLDTEYILLTDPDFVTFSKFIYNILNFTKSLTMLNCNHFFIFPAYHATKKQSVILENLSFCEYDDFLYEFFYNASIAPEGMFCEFIAPYSNNLLLSRDFFQISGGYNENFEGYGSEDFEFMIRCLLILNFSPLPGSLSKDTGKPHISSLSQKYSGFRRLLELYSLPLELNGFRFVHMYHDKSNKFWHKNHDKFRINFRENIAPILKYNKLILEYDWLPRAKSILCVVSNETRWRDFLKLRIDGYKLVLYKDIIKYENIVKFINIKEMDEIAITDDFLNLDERKSIFEKLLSHGIHVKILPNDNTYHVKYSEFSYACRKIDISRFTLKKTERLKSIFAETISSIRKKFRSTAQKHKKTM